MEPNKNKPPDVLSNLHLLLDTMTYPYFWNDDFKFDGIDRLMELKESILSELNYLQYNDGVLRNLQRLQTEGQVTDVTLKIEDRLFHAHRCVLASASPYFEAMFTAGFQESSKPEIEIKDIDSLTFELLLTCAYSGKMGLSAGNAIDMLRAACYLQFTHAHDITMEFLTALIKKKKMSFEDTFRVLQIADDHNKSQLYQDCLTFLVTAEDTGNFLQLMRTEGFRHYAQAEVVVIFLSKINLPVETNEEQVCYFKT